MSSNKGNPYRKGGKFASASNYDTIIYEPEPNKDRQIAKNKEQADSLNNDYKELNEQYRKAQASRHEKVSKLFNDNFKKFAERVNKVDLTNVSAVENLSYTILKELGNDTYSCMSVASVIANIFKRRGIKYLLCNGNCQIKGETVNKNWINHTWVEALGNTYEYFKDFKKEDLGKHTII